MQLQQCSGKIYIPNANNHKRKRSQISDVSLQETKEEQIKPKASRRKDMTKIRAKISKRENRKMSEEINENQKLVLQKDQ